MYKVENPPKGFKPSGEDMTLGLFVPAAVGLPEA